MLFLLFFIDKRFSTNFHIDETSGDISVIQPLDREVIGNISLEVIATDVTKPENTSQQCDSSDIPNKKSPVQMKVDVNIQDMNDNPPVFNDKHLSKGILRNIKFDTVVLDLTVSFKQFIEILKYICDHHYPSV